jgi:hypothetical protein
MLTCCVMLVQADAIFSPYVKAGHIPSLGFRSLVAREKERLLIEELPGEPFWQGNPNCLQAHVEFDL